MPLKLSDSQEIEGIVNKDPNADLPFGFDWSNWLPSGRAIVSATWEATGVELHDQAIVDGKKSTVFLRGGTLGFSYLVRCRITTDGAPPLIDDRSFLVKVIER